MLCACLLLSAATARAASLQKVGQGTWGVSGLPGYVNMYLYVPDKLAPKPAILVAAHHCGGSAQSTFNETKASFVSLADQNGFLIIFPEATGHNCWDVGSAKSLQHDGGGDTHAIAQMVRYARTKYDADASRVYAFGTSSGAMMTEALMGVYPDLFMAGVSVAGVPCGCWAEQYSGDSGPNAQWSGPCAGGNVSKTAQQWGDRVRAMFPGYMGHRPRVQLWHGTADTTISFKNLAESIKEWTNLLSLSEVASASDSAMSGYTHQSWKSACGYVVLEAWAQQGAGHDVRWDPASAAGFLGLDRAGGADPEAVACPGPAGGAAGAVSAGVGGRAGAAAESGASAGRGGAGAAADGGMQAGRGDAGAAADSGVSGGRGSAGAAADSGMQAGRGAIVAAGSAAAGRPSASRSQQASAGAVAQPGAAAVAGAMASIAPPASASAPAAASSGGCSATGGLQRELGGAAHVALLFAALLLGQRRRKRRAVRQ